MSPDHKTVVQVTMDLVQPNVIVGTPDGKILYVADIGARKTWSHSINSDGSLNDKKLFCEMGSDGMTIDEQGNLYLTGRGVTIFNKRGENSELSMFRKVGQPMYVLVTGIERVSL